MSTPLPQPRPGYRFEHLMLKPDRLNATPILRGVRETGGVRIQTTTVVFPPTMTQDAPPVRDVREQAHEFAQRLVTISERIGDPVIKAQAISFRKRVANAALATITRATLIERERIRQVLLSHGLTTAAEAIT